MTVINVELYNRNIYINIDNKFSMELGKGVIVKTDVGLEFGKIKKINEDELKKIKKFFLNL